MYIHLCVSQIMKGIFLNKFTQILMPNINIPLNTFYKLTYRYVCYVYITVASALINFALFVFYYIY